MSNIQGYYLREREKTENILIVCIAYIHRIAHSVPDSIKSWMPKLHQYTTYYRSLQKSSNNNTNKQRHKKNTRKNQPTQTERKKKQRRAKQWNKITRCLPSIYNKCESLNTTMLLNSYVQCWVFINYTSFCSSFAFSLSHWLPCSIIPCRSCWTNLLRSMEEHK